MTHITHTKQMTHMKQIMYKIIKSPKYTLIVLGIILAIILIYFGIIFKNNDTLEYFSEINGPLSKSIGNNTNFNYTGQAGIANLHSGNTNKLGFDYNQVSIATILNNL